MKSKVLFTMVLLFAGWIAWNAYEVAKHVRNPIVVALSNNQ